MNERRIATLLVDPEIFVEMCKPADDVWRTVTKNPLPKDAKFIGAQFDVIGGYWRIGVESSEFEPVPMGVEAPTLPPVEVTRVVRDCTCQ